MENVNNSIEKTASNDKSKKEIETNEKKYNSDTGQPQARKFKNILKGVIGWGGITVAVLAVILWILHNWLGYLIVSVENKWDFADSQCQWLNKNLSLWLVGKGMLRVPEDGYWYLDKYHFKKDTLNFRIKYFNHSNNTIRTNAFRSFRYMMKGYREIRENRKNLPLIIERLEDEVPLIRQNAASMLCFYGDMSVIPHLEKALKTETDNIARNKIISTIRTIKYRNKNNLKLPWWGSGQNKYEEDQEGEQPSATQQKRREHD